MNDGIDIELQWINLCTCTSLDHWIACYHITVATLLFSSIIQFFYHHDYDEPGHHDPSHGGHKYEINVCNCNFSGLHIVVDVILLLLLAIIKHLNQSTIGEEANLQINLVSY